jgi:hypothetical protein
MEFQYYLIRWDHHGQQSANGYTWIQFLVRLCFIEDLCS